MAYASTNVCGPIDTDTTWTLAGSPYIATCGILVSSGATLTIEAGVTVKFPSAVEMQVDGTLIARGTQDSPITFTSNVVNPAAGDWGGITFSYTSPSATFDGDTYTGGSILQYAIVEYGGYGSRKGTVSAEGSAPFIDHNTVRYNTSRGIYAYTIGIRITGNNVYNNSVYYYDGSIYTYNYSTVSGNTVYNNPASGTPGYGGGIYAVHGTVSGNTIYSNWATYWGGGIHAGLSTVSGNTVYNNGAFGGAGISTSDSTVSGNTVFNNSATYYGGGIDTSGGTVSGNTVYNNSASESGGGIYAGGSTVSENTVYNNSASEGSGIYAWDSTVSCNTVVNNSSSAQVSGGLQIYGQPQVISNTIYANSPYDLVNNNPYIATPLDATNNYWGTTDSAEVAAHIYDFFDDSSRQRVVYEPFLSAPDPCAPLAPTIHRIYLPAIANNYAGGW